MSEIKEQIEALNLRLNNLVKTQIDFQREVTQIRVAIEKLRSADVTGSQTSAKPLTQEPKPEQFPKTYVRVPFESEKNTIYEAPRRAETKNAEYVPFEAETGESSRNPLKAVSEKASLNLEKFIGENLLSKIGILILVIGVAIFGKYAIDNGWVSPMMRVIFGYLIGFALIGLAIKLKPKYLNFSSVLLSGGMAIMYFITYFGYAIYELISQRSAFALMFIFTAFTVVAAWNYSKQIIAHLGLVGAYAIPFLLGNESGNYTALFVYMTITNCGILAVSLKKYWTPIFYTASAFTWLIFFAWLVSKYDAKEHFGLALIFVGLFAAIFYATKIIHTTLQAAYEKIEVLIGAVGTAFIFFAFTLGISSTAIESTQYWQMFAFVAIFAAVFFISSLRYFGKPILYVTAGSVWLIYGSWFLNRYTADEHVTIAWVFSALFFMMVYAAVLAHRFGPGKLNIYENAGLVLTNAFLFYGAGYAIVDSKPETSYLLGLFTVAHAAMHFVIATVVGRLKNDAADVVNVLTILILTFVSIAVPVQFDGNVLTMIWAVEAALLFYFGRTKQIELFEYFSFPLVVLATGSLLTDWVRLAGDQLTIGLDASLIVGYSMLVTGVVYSIAMLVMFFINRKAELESPLTGETRRILKYVFLLLATVGLYNTFRSEISTYFHNLSITDDAVLIKSSSTENVIWQIDYTLLFLSILAFLNLNKWADRIASNVIAGFLLALTVTFLLVGLICLDDLRPLLFDSGLDASHYQSVHYASLAILAIGIYFVYQYSRTQMFEKVKDIAAMFDLYFAFIVFVVSTFELTQWLNIFGYRDSFKLAVSILWGVYALILVSIGIYLSRKHLRIAAIVLFAITLGKIFFYDISELNTISKTVVFVSLGILILIVGFLYNKYTSHIFQNKDTTEGEDLL